MSNAEFLKKLDTEPLKLQLIINDEIMDLGAASELQSKRSTLRSMSHHALNKDYKTPVEGLKKLATNYRNTVKSNKLDVERYRALVKDKRPLTDPRFRRERTRSPKKANHSQSEGQFGLIQQYIDKNHTHSAPTVSQKKNTVAVPLETISSGHVIENPHPVMVEKECSPFVSHQGTSMSEGKGEGANSCEEKSKTRALSIVKTTQDGEQSKPKKGELKKKEKWETDSLVLSNSSLCIIRRKHHLKNFIKLHNLSIPYQNDPHLIERLLVKKYPNLLSMSSIKKTRSSMTLPLLTPRIYDSMYMCSRCSCLKGQEEGGYTYENDTDFLDTNSVVAIDTRNTLFKDSVSSYYMAIFYIVGCFFGLSFVAFVAWILSNDLIWSWVNQRKEVPPPKKITFLTSIFSYIGGAVFFTLNLVLGSIYELFTLPRNAVFREAEQERSLWNYFK